MTPAIPGTSAPSRTKPERRLSVFMMDLWATVPYYTAYLSRALIREGVNVQIGSITYYLDPACFSSRGLRLDPGISNLIGRYPLPRGPRRILKLAEGLLNLAALTVRFLFRPPDVVHVQFLTMLRSRFPVDLWFVRFCRRRGSKIVLTVHDLLPHDTADQHKDVFMRLYREVDELICHSDHVKARLESEFGIAPEKIAVIPHGPFFFDLPEADPTPTLRSLGVHPGQSMVLWQGIIFPYKGLDLLLDSWQTVEAEAPGAVLVVMGTGAPELLEQAREQVARLGLNRVKLDFQFASTERLVAAYRAADLVVYPYRAITTSGAIATGMALGKPMVASALPVFAELLEHGTNALLVEPRDKGQLAGAIVELLRNDDLRERFAASMRARDFGSKSWLSIAEKTRRLYEEVAGRSRNS